MPWESEEESVKPGRDWSKILWIVVLLLIVVGVGALFMPKQRVNAVTEARVKHILIKVDTPTEAGAAAALEKIQSIRQRILNGESFAKLAEEYSQDPSSQSRGGDLGWVRRGELNDTIDNFIWNCNVGEVSDVILTQFGLHLVVVTERHFSDAERYEEQLKERVLEENDTESAPEAK